MMAAPRHDPPSTRATWMPVVLAVTLVQAVLALASRSLPLFAMPLTAAAGMPPEAVGQLSSATALGSMVFFLWGPVVLSRLPAIGQLQLGCVVCALALAFCTLGQWPALLLGSFVIGLGFGTSTPAGAELLMRVAPIHRRATIFSVKQAGVPLGGLAAGLLLPAMALRFGGVDAALLCAAALALLAAALLWRCAHRTPPPLARVTDHPLRRLRLRHLLLAPLRLVGLLMHARHLRLLSTAGLCLGIAQGVVMGFFVVILSDHAGWSLSAAGAGFALLQAMGIPGRIAMGWLSDRLGDPVPMLCALCFASAATLMLLATLGPETPVLRVALLAALTGLTVVSWNGVFLSALAGAAPEGRASEITAAGTFVLFSGYVLCPLLLQAVFSARDGYGTGLILAALAPALAGCALLWRHARRHSHRKASPDADADADALRQKDQA